MGQETIEDIIKRKQAAASSATAPVQPEVQEDKFFSMVIGDSGHEMLIDFRTRDGWQTSLPYTAITWMVYDPENGISIDFGGYLVTIKGRGLVPKLHDALRQKRVAWVKEADVELQDNKANDLFISEIIVVPPQGFAEEEETTDS